MSPKTLLKTVTERLSCHLFSRESLPAGVNWLLDIQRGRALGAAPVCFDVGANVGQTVHEILKVFPRAQIHAFEPFESPRAALTLATRANPRVVVVPLAMGSSTGRLQVAPHARSELSSLVEASAPRGGGPLETIEVDTLDGYCARLGIQIVDVLKTDTEGYDLEVLRGASGLLGSQRIAYVLVEVTFIPGNPQNTPFSPVFEMMTAHDYRFLGLYETYPLHFYEEPIVFCNALFVASAWRQRSLQARRMPGQGDAAVRT